jgi:hypothetical protein
MHADTDVGGITTAAQSGHPVPSQRRRSRESRSRAAPCGTTRQTLPTVHVLHQPARACVRASRLRARATARFPAAITAHRSKAIFPAVIILRTGPLAALRMPIKISPVSTFRSSARPGRYQDFPPARSRSRRLHARRPSCALRFQLSACVANATIPALPDMLSTTCLSSIVSHSAMRKRFSPLDKPEW